MHSSTSATLGDLDVAFDLSAQQIQSFRENGFIKLKNVLSPETLARYGAAITAAVTRLNQETRPLQQRNTYGKAFLQIGNIWTKDAVVKEFAFSRRLARIAAELMGCSGVRMYHDQALYKEAGGGHTPWHADQFYWPLSTHNTCTVWVPLQATPIEMGPLAFSRGSHRMKVGRDLEISDESEAKISRYVLEHKYAIDETPFDLGEVSYHYGWTFHRAGPNRSDRPRRVMTVIYMDENIRVAQPANKAQENDWQYCLPGAKLGEIPNTPVNPVLWSALKAAGE